MEHLLLQRFGWLIALFCGAFAPMTWPARGRPGERAGVVATVPRPEDSETPQGTARGGGEGHLRFSYANSLENIEEALRRIKDLLAK